MANKQQNNNKNKLLIRAIYLGSEPMGELLEGENGSDAVQVPLKRTILRTDGHGEEVDLYVADQCLNINFHHQKRLLNLPIDSLAYCGALRQLPSDQVNEREFETLDKIPQAKIDEDPPLFVTIFRNIENENTLLCHSFVLRKDTEAMDLVKLVMESYYDILKQFEFNRELSIDADEVSSNANQSVKSPLPPPPPLPKTPEPKLEQESNFVPSPQISSYVTSMESYPFSTRDSPKKQTTTTSIINDDEMNRLLDLYNSTLPLKGENSVSAKEILEKSLDPSKYEILTNENQIPKDDDTLVIKKKNDEKLIYEQNVYVRWLQPPTPPPPAPIIIREVQGPQEEQPPLIIYKQAPREPTPPPLVIREKPPSPIPENREPIVIERVVKPDPLPRRVIVEELPAPPAKPRDIILEKWLPKESPKRQIIIEKAIQPSYSTSKRSQSSKKAIEYPTKSHRDYDSPDRYNRTTSKPIGYRIIRQVIPGATATADDIEKALARSKHISTANFQKLDSRTSTSHSTQRYGPPPPPSIKHLTYNPNELPLTNHSSRSRFKEFDPSPRHHHVIRNIPVEQLD